MCRSTCCSAAWPSLAPTSFKNTALSIFGPGTSSSGLVSRHDATVRYAYSGIGFVEKKTYSAAQTLERVQGHRMLCLVDITLIVRYAKALSKSGLKGLSHL